MTGTSLMTAEAFLEHHGTKGMKWGVRKATSVAGGSTKAAYVARTEKASATWKRVSEGKGSKSDNFRTAMNTPVNKLVTGKRKAYADKVSKNLDEHVQRINNGETKIKDVLIVAHNLRVSDIAKGLGNVSLKDAK